MSLLIAEIGQNHCGDMELAKRLIVMAKANGADLVKFQLYNHKALYGKKMKDVSLSYKQAKELFEYGERWGIEVFFSVFDQLRVQWCEDIGVKRYKVSAMMRDADTLYAIDRTGKPVIVSGNDLRFPQITTLLCLPGYPVKYVDFRDLHKYDGFSDHTIGMEAAELSMSLGAKVIEKHFAIDHETGVDAQWSMTPEELRRFHADRTRVCMV